MKKKKLRIIMTIIRIMTLVIITFLSEMPSLDVDTNNQGNDSAGLCYFSGALCMYECPQRDGPY